MHFALINPELSEKQGTFSYTVPFISAGSKPIFGHLVTNIKTNGYFQLL